MPMSPTLPKGARKPAEVARRRYSVPEVFSAYPTCANCYASGSAEPRRIIVGEVGWPAQGRSWGVDYRCRTKYVRHSERDQLAIRISPTTSVRCQYPRSG